MSKKTFNPQEWASTGVCHTPHTPPPVRADLRVYPNPTPNPQPDIETITTRIEAAAIDIAPHYADWRDLGFALADALGESGRSYYHR